MIRVPPPKYCVPIFLVHGEKCFYIAVATVWQRCYKHIGRDDFSGIRISDGGSIAGPVHLHDFARLVVQVHGCVDLCQIVSIVLVELS